MRRAADFIAAPARPWDYIATLEDALEAACNELASYTADSDEDYAAAAWWTVSRHLTVCGWCGTGGAGDAAVGVVPLHHGDGRDCYRQAQRAWGRA